MSLLGADRSWTVGCQFVTFCLHTLLEHLIILETFLQTCTDTCVSKTYWSVAGLCCLIITLDSIFFELCKGIST